MSILPHLSEVHEDEGVKSAMTYNRGLTGTKNSLQR
jgi:hypothetical protein